MGILLLFTALACSKGSTPPAGDGGIPADGGIPTDGGIPADGGVPPVNAISFQEEQRLTIADGMGHLAFPDITRLGDGRILLVYRQGASHVDTTGRIMKQFGTADGRTWTTPEALHDEPGIDDRDPSVATLADGRVMVTYFQYRILPRAGGNLYLHQVYAGFSTDQGATFGPFSKITPGPMGNSGASLDASKLWVDLQGNHIMVSAASSPAIELGGRLVVPAYGGHALNVANLAGAPRSRISLLISATAAGSSWDEVPVLKDEGPRVWVQEPVLLQLKSGDLLMQIRTATGDSPSSPGSMAQSRSSDNGASWSPWAPFGFIGHAPNLCQLKNGVILSAFREINQAYTREWVSYIYSLDDGTTWTAPIRLEDCGAAECGYPSMLELDGDRVLIVYYSAGGVAIKGVILGFQTS